MASFANPAAVVNPAVTGSLSLPENPAAISSAPDIKVPSPAGG